MIGTRIGAALLIVVASFLMMGFEVAGFGQSDLAVDYTVTGPDGAPIPVITD